MSENQETIADILEEMKKEALKFGKHWKEGRNVIATNIYAASIYSFADRIEAAAKAENAKLREALKPILNINLEEVSNSFYAGARDNDDNYNKLSIAIANAQSIMKMEANNG